MMSKTTVLKRTLGGEGGLFGKFTHIAIKVVEILNKILR